MGKLAQKNLVEFIEHAMIFSNIAKLEQELTVN